jgi:hypothetical protein
MIPSVGLALIQRRTLMAAKQPAGVLAPQFSSADAAPTPWAVADEQLQHAELFWLTTVRPEGRPHVTPLLSVWVNGKLYFSTGEDERKAKNLLHNTHCILTTGRNTLNQEGLDLVIEGEAVRIYDTGELRRVADAYRAKYGSDWSFAVRKDGVFLGGQGNVALVYGVAPTTAFGFGKGKTFSQTRWRF